MNIKTLSAVAIVTAALTAQAFAQYHRVHGQGYCGRAYYGSSHGVRTFRSVYARLSVGESFLYGDGWVPESFWDPSRVGGEDPDIRPSAN
jgi:hypothetical protein